MSLNTYVTRQEVLDGMNAMFQVRVGLLDYANKTLVNRTQMWDLPKYGNGQTIQVRKRVVTRGTLTDIATLNGAFTKTLQFVEQETIDVTVDSFYNSFFELNAVNQKLFLNGESANDNTVYAATNDLVFKTQKYLYDRLILNANILALSPATSLNNQTTLGQIHTVSIQNNMPQKACLMISNTAAKSLQSHFGAYLNDKASTPALTNRIPPVGYFSEIFSDNVVTRFDGGTANASNGVATLSIAAVNGDTTLTIDNLLVGNTIIVGAAITLNSPTVSAMARGTYQVINQDINQPSFIAQDAPATNPNFTPAVKDANGIIITPGFYTVPGGGVLTVTIQAGGNGSKVATSGNFQTIQAPGASIPIGTPVVFYAPHIVSFVVADTGISFASPKITPIENATNTYSNYKDVNLRYATQGDLSTETNAKELASMWGGGFDGFYLIRVMTNN